MQKISLKLLGIAIATLLVLCGFQVITPLNNTASAIKDEIGTTGEITKDLTVKPTFPQPGETVRFDLNITGTTTTDITWDFGDGTTDSGKMKTNHVYDTAGTYYYSYEAEHGDGTGGRCENMIIHIGGPDPRNSYIARSPVNPIEGETVAFTPHILDLISVIEVNWVWGDGTTSSNAGENTIEHNYNEFGTYNGRLKFEGFRTIKQIDDYRRQSHELYSINNGELTRHNFLGKTQVGGDVDVYILKLDDADAFYFANSNYIVGQRGTGFTANTMIEMTDDSNKEISEIQVGEKVHGYKIISNDELEIVESTVTEVYTFKVSEYHIVEAEGLGTITATKDCMLCCPQEIMQFTEYFQVNVYDNEYLAETNSDSAIEDINSGTNKDKSGMNNKIESAFENIQNLYNEFCDGPDNYDLFDIFKNSEYNGIVGGDSVANRLNKLMSKSYLRDPKRDAVKEIRDILRNKKTDIDYAESFNFAKENIGSVDDFRNDLNQSQQENLSKIETALDNELSENPNLDALISFIAEEIENSDENNDGGGITNGQMIAWLLYTFFMGGLITSTMMPVALVVGAVVSLVVSIALVILLRKVGVSQMIGSYLNDITAQIPYISDIIDADDWYLIVSLLAGMVIFGGTFAAIIALKPLQFMVGGAVSDAIVFVLFTVVSEIAKLIPEDSSNPRPIDRHPMLENMPILNTILYRLFDRNPATFLILKRIFGYVPA